MPTTRGLPEIRQPRVRTVRVSRAALALARRRAMRLNACELEIDLFCRGLRVPPSVSLAGARGISRTRAGLGSGLEIVIPAHSWLKRDIWMNAPVVERFVERSPYVLEGSRGVRLRDRRQPRPHALPGAAACRARLVPPPDLARHSDVAHRRPAGHVSRDLHQPHLRVLELRPAAQLPLLHDRRERRLRASPPIKTVDDVVETCHAARDASGVTFVHFNGGFQGSRGLRSAEPYVPRDQGKRRAARRRPAHAGKGLHRLRPADRSRRRSFLVLRRALRPGLVRAHLSRQGADARAGVSSSTRWTTARLAMPRGAVSGEIIAGLEPIDSTLAAIERITSVGAFPTVCVFRPTVGSDMEDWPPPDYDDMRRVLAGGLRRVPAAPRADRSRAEHRGEPGRQSGRRGDAGAEDGGHDRLRSVAARAARGGAAGVRVADAGRRADDVGCDRRGRRTWEVCSFAHRKSGRSRIMRAKISGILRRSSLLRSEAALDSRRSLEEHG